jgi:pimeloyl-ACP methyl ester carboxylesterase
MKILYSSDHDNIPLIFLGHSFGTTVAYELLQQLLNDSSTSSTEKEKILESIQLFISICGISTDYLQQLSLYNNKDLSYDTMDKKQLHSLINENSLEMFDLIPSYLKDPSSKAYHNTLQDIKYTSQLVKLHQKCILTNLNASSSSSFSKIEEIPFSWIIGNKDKTSQLSKDFWKNLFPNSYETIVFKGNHFFFFENQMNFEKVLNEIQNIINRRL